MTQYKWQESYQAALLEFDAERLKAKLAAAEAAIFHAIRNSPPIQTILTNARA